ncbi:MAG: hypothetical protein ACOCRX_00820 [Candidatus Woesearchaeota archaeon]
MTISYMGIGNDGYLSFISELEEMKKELNRLEKNTVRLNVNTEDIDILTIDEINDLGFQMKNNENVLALEYKDKLYSISNTAYLSLKQRIELNGDGLFNLSPELLKQVVTSLIQKRSKIQLIIIDGKVRAFFSSSKKGYKPIPSYEAFNAVLEFSKERFKNIEFKFGKVEYTTQHVKLLFPDKKEELTGLYGVNNSFTPGLLFITSDTGYSGKNVFPIWQHEKGTIVMGDYEESVQMTHRFDASLDKLKKEMNFVFLKLIDSFKLIKKQANISIEYPINVIDKICEKYKIGKRAKAYFLGQLDLWSIKNPDKKVSAFDIINFFIKLSLDLPNKKKQHKYEIISGKLLHLDFKKLDNFDI